METVAINLDAPVKFLFPNPGGSYPFRVLGLGDVAVNAQPSTNNFIITMIQVLQIRLIKK